MEQEANDEDENAECSLETGSEDEYDSSSYENGQDKDTSEGDEYQDGMDDGNDGFYHLGPDTIME